MQWGGDERRGGPTDATEHGAERAVERVIVDRRDPAVDGRRVSLREDGRTVAELREQAGEVTDLRMRTSGDAAGRLAAVLREVAGDDDRVVVRVRRDRSTPTPGMRDLCDPAEAPSIELLMVETTGQRRVDELREHRVQVERVIDPPSMHVPAAAELYERREYDRLTKVARLEEPSAWISTRNPGSPIDAGRLSNCGDCARATESRWRGVEATAASCRSLDGEPDEVMRAWSPGALVETDLATIQQRLRDLGPGASAIVGIEWADRPGGHWVNAFNDRGIIVAADGQQGVVGSWPPDEGRFGFDAADLRTVEAILVAPDGTHLGRDHHRSAYHG